MSPNATAIKAAVEQARSLLPDLPGDYADKAVAAGRTLMQVKSELVDRMCAQSPRATSKANMRKQLAGMRQEPEAGAASDTGRALSSMERELRAQGLAPVGR